MDADRERSMSDDRRENRQPGGNQAEPTISCPIDRFNAFTDGVLAIVITLLVLELSVPAVEDRMLPALAEDWHEFLGYVISFVFVGGLWVGHSGMTKLMRRRTG